MHINITMSNNAYTAHSQQTATALAQQFALGVLAFVAAPMLFLLGKALVGGIFTLIWLGRYALLQYKPSQALSARWLLLPIIVIIAVVFHQFGTIFGATGGVALLLLLSLLKTYESSSIRDWQFLLLALLFLAPGALLFSQEIPAFLWAIAILYAVLAGLNLLDHNQLGVSLRYVGMGLLYALPFAIALFLIIPRPAEPLLRLVPEVQQIAKTGLTDVIRPGAFSRLLEHDELAFTAVFTNDIQPKNTELYWRAIVLSDFDGFAWHKDRLLTRLNNSTPSSDAAINYELIVSDWKGHIPALDYPLKTSGATFLSNAATVMGERSYNGLRRLQLTSSLSNTMPDVLSSFHFRRYTQLPAGNPQARALAERLYQQSQGDTAHYIQQLLAYFVRQPFTYTTKPPLLNDNGNAIDAFLFQTQAGYCEHYASATAWLLRAANIPARVVTGYLGGRYHAGGGFWEVSSQDAHAWVEVWHDNKQQWQRLDPTMVIDNDHRDATLALGTNTLKHDSYGQHFSAWLDQHFSQWRFYWRQWVINYDNDLQQRLWHFLGGDKLPVFLWPVVLLIILFVALLPMLIRLMKHRRAPTIDPLKTAFLRMKRRFIAKTALSDALGPEDFRHHLKKQQQLSADMNQLLDDYIKMRFIDGANPRQIRQWQRRARRQKP